MPRRCSICHHEGLEGINRALVEGIAFPVLVAKYRVSKTRCEASRLGPSPSLIGPRGLVTSVLP